MLNPRKKISPKLITPQRTRTKGKANALIHLTDLHEVAEAAEEVEVVEVEIVMVTERTAVKEDVVEAEEREAVEDVEGDEVDSEASITTRTMRTVVDLVVVLGMTLAVIQDSVATVKTEALNVAEEEDEDEALVVDLVVALVVDLVVPKVMMQTDLRDVVDSGDVEEVEVVEVVEDHVNLTDEVEMTRAVQLKHLTNVTDPERTIGEHQEMN